MVTGISYKDAETGKRVQVRALSFQEGKISFLSEEGKSAIGSVPEPGLCMKRFKGDLQTRGIRYERLSAGQQLQIGSLMVRITSIGKQCHSTECNQFNKHTACVMLRETMFGVVTVPGIVTIGDSVEVI